MKKIRLTETQLKDLVKKIINEQYADENNKEINDPLEEFYGQNIILFYDPNQQKVGGEFIIQNSVIDLNVPTFGVMIELLNVKNKEIGYLFYDIKDPGSYFLFNKTGKRPTSTQVPGVWVVYNKRLMSMIGDKLFSLRYTPKN
jgi:hypothetical protein